MSKNVVSVAFPIAIPGVYDYCIPDGLAGKVVPGMPVLVSLRSRQLWGMAVQLKEHSPFKDLKPVLDIKANMRLSTYESLIRLYEWIASYYCCELGTVFKPFVRKKIVETAAKTEVVYCMSESGDSELTPRQREAADLIAGNTGPFTRADLLGRFGLSDHLINILCRKGILAKTERVVQREVAGMTGGADDGEIQLTEEQVAAVQTIRTWCDKPGKPVLLHGITGSGKTHVYIELARHVLSQNKGVIVLVPEIALTPQTIQRFKNALGNEIAVIHSHMSDGERRDSLEQLIAGRRRMVIGVRSAILAPVKDPGLIIVDEEHDGSYKQSEPDPRYQARDVAIMRGHFQKTCVVLGSATPSLETCHNAKRGKYELVKLNNRFGSAVLPRIHLVDMNVEHAENNWTFLSRYLRERILETLGQKRQIILLLNRRGFSTFLLCKDCGHVYACPNCSVNLTYHRSDSSLKCHQCGHRTPAPQTCTKCAGTHLKYKGTGIQKAEEALRELIPDARIIRMDQDTTRHKGAHATILGAFAANKADILLGTQMVAKGLNFPGVKLVGVLQADVGLHIPDFRAAEKTFQLLTQVAGRAGRHDNRGEVVIQTYFPTDPAILSARAHDYDRFFSEEIINRKALRYPPFSRLARVLVTGNRERTVKNLIHAAARAVQTSGAAQVALLGPVPAPLVRIKNDFRYTLLLKSPSVVELHKALRAVRALPRESAGQMRLVIDVDPTNML